MKELEPETIIRSYLLGALDESARERVEQRLMTDRDYKEEVLIGEEELLEDYVTGVLGQQERDLFLTNYLTTPLQKQKLRMAQALDKRARMKAPQPVTLQAAPNFHERFGGVRKRRSLFLQLSWAALIVIVVVGSWLIFRSWRTGQDLQAELLRLNGPSSSLLDTSPSVTQLSLSPFTLRESGNLPTVTITNDTQVVQLRTPQPSSQPQIYQAVLKDSHGAEVLRVPGLTIRNVNNAKILAVQLPSRVLTSGDYTLTFADQNSSEDIADYSFRVIRQQN
jgi:hypothetical protein